MLRIYSILLHILVLFVFWYLHGQKKKHRLKEHMLREQEKYFGELVGQYAGTADMTEALRESMQIGSRELGLEISRLIDALEAGGFSEESENYCRTCSNAYFLLFFTLCNTIRTFGDQEFQGISLFVYNLRYIKEEVRLSLLRMIEGDYAFLGLPMLSLLPFFFLYPIERWAVGISGELGRFYSGSYGFVTLTVCFVLTVVCTFAVEILHHPLIRRNPGRSSKRGNPHTLWTYLLNLHINRHYSYYLKKNERLKELQGQGNVQQYLGQKFRMAVMCLLLAMLLFALYDSFGVRRNTLRLQLVFCLMAFVSGFFLPDVRLILLQSEMQQQKMEETLRYETLILIVMHYRQITVEEILRWMERFSVVFQDAVAHALDDFSYQRNEALGRLTKDLSYLPATRLLEHLQACDNITIEQAFYDLEGERAYDMDQYKQQADAIQREKAAFARILAFLPFVAVLALRLIIPFVLEGLGQFSAYR